jgi:hypothetical protein
MKNLDKIAEDLFRKVRSRFSDIKLGDESGALTQEPTTARFFDVNFKANEQELGRVNIKLNDDSLTVIFSNSIIENQGINARQEWFSFLKDMRQFAKSNLLTFDTRDITKSNLEKRDYQYLAKETGEPKMSESKLFGTSKTSYQDMGEAKIIVKHSAPVNYDNPAGRTQRIESIYIESSSGERFRYAHRHLNGARAMARHIANGGNAYDQVGGYISGLSEELSKLRQFKNYTQRSGLIGEALGDIGSKVIERIDTIKQEIHNLQKQSYYESFKESFQPGESLTVPEDIMQDWVDALTIKTFNEELTSVFPYIYKLVAEKQEGELRYDDLVAEQDQSEEEDETEEDVSEHSLFSDFEEQLDTVSSFEYDVVEADKGDMDHDGQDEPDDQEYKQNKSMAIKKAMAQEQESVLPQEVVEFIASMYDRETGTFPRGEEGVKIAVEKKFGEQAGRFANFVVEKLSAKNQPAMQEEPEAQNSDLIRIRELSGVSEAGAGFAEGDKVIYMDKHNATVVGQDGADYFIKIDGQPGSMKVIGSQLAAPGAKPAAAPSPFKRGDTVMWNGEQVTYIRPVDGSPGQSYITQASGSDEIVNDKELTKESFEALDIIKSLAGM